MMTGADIQQLKDYVAGPASGIQNRVDSTVLLQVSHSNLSARFMEIRLDMHMTVDAVKTKLTSHVGTSPSAMILQLKDERGSVMATLSAERKLGYYSPHDGCVLHIIDTDPSSLSAGGWLEDVSKVVKYEISDEAYNMRENTYRKFKEKKLQEDPSWTLEKEMATRRGVPHVPAANEKVNDPHFQEAEASTICMGDRCEVSPGGKRGTVRYVGTCEGLPIGFWVGVQFDEPVGKNDGSAMGKRYFECDSGYGGLVRPTLVSCGDYPPLDDFQFSDEDEI